MHEKIIEDLILAAIHSEFKKKDQAFEYAKNQVTLERKKIHEKIEFSETFMKKHENELKGKICFQCNDRYNISRLKNELLHLDLEEKCLKKGVVYDQNRVVDEHQEYFYSGINQIIISYTEFMEITGLSRITLKRNMEILVEKSLVKRTRIMFGYVYIREERKKGN